MSEITNEKQSGMTGDSITTEITRLSPQRDYPDTGLRPSLQWTE
jgi:hypothetical protein